MSTRDQILMSIKTQVQQVLPNADIVLFGSRVNNTHTEESDWDILVKTHTPVTKILKKQVHEKIFPIGVTIGSFINILLVTEYDWQHNPSYYSLKKSVDLNSLPI